MKNRKSRYVLGLAVVILLFITQACQTQSLLIPPPHQVHLFKKQGEVQVSGTYSSSGYSGHLAVSPLPKFELFGSYHKNNFADGDEYQRQSLWEVGFGFYDDFDDPLITELMFGFGKGSSEFFDMDMTFRDTFFVPSPVRGDFSRVFSQFNLGITSKAIDLGFSFKLTHNRFPNYEFDVFPIPAKFNRYMNTAEPSIFANFGYKNLRFEGQLGYPILLGDQTSSQFRAVTFSAGIKLMLFRDFEWQDY